MHLSLPGLIGALAGLLVGYINYGAMAALIDRKLRNLSRPRPKANDVSEHKIVLLKRIVLVADMTIFPLIGYAFGRTIGG